MITIESSVRFRAPETTLRNGGYGHLTVGNELLIFWVPAGLEPGRCLRIRGHGPMESSSGKRGDLLIHLESEFINKDVHQLLTIKRDLMEDGGEMELHKNGQLLTVKIPPSVGNGTRLRLPQSAWFFGQPENVGDAYLTVAEEHKLPTWKDVLLAFGRQAYFKARLWFALPPFAGASFEFGGKNDGAARVRSRSRHIIRLG